MDSTKDFAETRSFPLSQSVASPNTNKKKTLINISRRIAKCSTKRNCAFCYSKKIYICPCSVVRRRSDEPRDPQVVVPRNRCHQYSLGVSAMMSILGTRDTHFGPTLLPSPSAKGARFLLSCRAGLWFSCIVYMLHRRRRISIACAPSRIDRVSVVASRLRCCLWWLPIELWRFLCGHFFFVCFSLYICSLPDIWLMVCGNAYI